MSQVEVPLAGTEGRRWHERKLLLLLLLVLGVLVVLVTRHHLRLLVVVEDLLGRLRLMIGGSRGTGLAGLHSQGSGGTSTSLHAQLTHPVDHAMMATSISSTASILSRLNAALQSLLQLPTEFLSIRPEVEEVVALLQRQPLLLG